MKRSPPTAMAAVTRRSAKVTAVDMSTVIHMSRVPVVIAAVTVGREVMAAIRAVIRVDIREASMGMEGTRKRARKRPHRQRCPFTCHLSQAIK